jgi:Arc/MetJ-type ribon-helix-helix transcriptional regulator
MDDIETVVKVTITMPEMLHRRIKAVAAMEGKSVSEIVRSGLEEYISLALEEDSVIRTALQVKEDLASGRQRSHRWEEVKERLRRNRQAEAVTAR